MCSSDLDEPFDDPGLPQQSAKSPVWQMMLGGDAFGPTVPLIGQFSNWAVIPVILVALLALVGKRWGIAFVLWVVAIATVEDVVALTAL